MVRKQVSFVLRLIDDFNGKDITGLAQGFYIKTLPVKPLYKPEGYYVFVDCEINDNLTIETVYYKTRELSINIIKAGEQGDVIIVRLYRKPMGVFTDCKQIEGTKTANKLVYIPYREISGLSFTKSSVQDGKTVIHLSGYSTEKLVGGCYCMGEDKSQQLFYITGKTKDGAYTVSGLKTRSQQNKQKLFRVYSDYCDKEGNFSIPVEQTDLKPVGKVSTLKDQQQEWGCYFEY